MIKDLLIQILKKTQEREQLITRLISRLDPDAYQGYENQEPASIARKVYDTKTKEANEIIQSGQHVQISYLLYHDLLKEKEDAPDAGGDSGCTTNERR